MTEEYSQHIARLNINSRGRIWYSKTIGNIGKAFNYDERPILKPPDLIYRSWCCTAATRFNCSACKWQPGSQWRAEYRESYLGFTSRNRYTWKVLHVFCALPSRLTKLWLPHGYRSQNALIALGVINALGFFCIFLVPETNQRSLEEISEVLTMVLWIPWTRPGLLLLGFNACIPTCRPCLVLKRRSVALRIDRLFF